MHTIYSIKKPIKILFDRERVFNINYKLINYCEFDKYASKAFSLIHSEPESKNLGDITKVNEKELDDFNMMVGGSPCQDFSVAGKQEGANWTCKNPECNHKYNPLEVHYSRRNQCPKCESGEIEKTRLSLLVEWLRVLKEKKPI
jgi:DNA (cytosine-5)-methyltransferase 1